MNINYVPAATNAHSDADGWAMQEAIDSDDDQKIITPATLSAHAK